MTRNKTIQGITAALAAVVLAGIVPGTALAQNGREDRRRDQRTEQRGDRDRNARQRPEQDSARNRERGTQNRDNDWRRDGDRDWDRDQRWRQNQERDRDGKRDNDGDRNNRDRNNDWDRNRDNRRDSDWNRNRDWDRDNRQEERWDNRDDNRWRDDEDEHRQQTKNNWRNLAIAAGGVAAYGILKNDPTIAFAGAAGALYSLNRYEQDRKSQNSVDRARASLFSQPYIYRDGQRYERRLVTKNGQRYYCFEKS